MVLSSLPYLGQHRLDRLAKLCGILRVRACHFLPVSSLAAQAKNIILMIGDGMGPSHFGAAWLYSNRVLGKELRMVEVMKSGRTAYLVNDTADAIVTESAGAATQIACGVRVPARAVGMGPDGKTPCTTVLELAKGKGLATGLVTTSGITDATPAAFATHVPHRSDEASVAAQELQAGVDVLLGGIYGGIFTPTEAAVVAVFYGLFVGAVVHRNLTWAVLYGTLRDAALSSAVVMVIVAFAGLFAWAGSTLGAMDKAAAFIISLSGSPWVTILWVNLLLFIAGMLLDAVPIYYVFLPIFLPVMAHFHWDPIWFGVVMTVNLATGQVTPPVAVNLYVAANLARISLETISRAVVPFVLAMLGALLVITYLPRLPPGCPSSCGSISEHGGRRSGAGGRRGTRTLPPVSRPRSPVPPSVRCVSAKADRQTRTGRGAGSIEDPHEGKDLLAGGRWRALLPDGLGELP